MTLRRPIPIFSARDAPETLGQDVALDDLIDLRWGDSRPRGVGWWWRVLGGLRSADWLGSSRSQVFYPSMVWCPMDGAPLHAAI